MSLEKVQLESLSASLINAEDTGIPTKTVTEIYPEITIPEAYSIQLLNVEKRVGSGSSIVGMKVGLTSKVLQESYNTGEPNFGHILNKGVFIEGKPISIKGLNRPRIEGEICFLLNKDLKGPGITAGAVLAATAGVMPAFEIVTSRYNNPKVKIQDAIADNSSNYGVVLGARLTPINNLDLRLIGMNFEQDGEIIATATGAAVLGNPAQAVSWLANKLVDFNLNLKSGQLIMAGSLISPVPIKANSTFTATFDHLGPVSIRFVD